jgi:hypothetical protein
MRFGACALSVAATICVAGCSAQTNGVLTQGNTVRLVSGLYTYSLANCPGADALDLVGSLDVGGTSVAGFRSDPSNSTSVGRTWLQAGTYIARVGKQALGSCPGVCAPSSTTFREMNGCGWSLKLSLLRSGNP